MTAPADSDATGAEAPGRRVVLAVSRLAVAAVVSVLLAWFTPSATSACVCFGRSESPSEEWVKSDAVFYGRVRDVRAIQLPLREEAVRFDVLKSWKGIIGSEVVATNLRTDCSIYLPVGEEYVIWASWDHYGYLSTSVCSRTAPLHSAVAAADIDFLDRGTALYLYPRQWALALIGGTAAGAAVLAWRLRARWAMVRIHRGAVAAAGTLLVVAPMMIESVRRGTFLAVFPVPAPMRPSFDQALYLWLGISLLAPIGFVILGAGVRGLPRWQGVLGGLIAYLIVGVVWLLATDLVFGRDVFTTGLYVHALIWPSELTAFATTRLGTA